MLLIWQAHLPEANVLFTMIQDDNISDARNEHNNTCDVYAVLIDWISFQVSFASLQQKLLFIFHKH